MAVYFLRPAGPIELMGAPLLGGALFGALLLMFGIILTTIDARWNAAESSDPQPVRWMGVAVSVATIGCTGLAIWALISR